MSEHDLRIAARRAARVACLWLALAGAAAPSSSGEHRNPVAGRDAPGIWPRPSAENRQRLAALDLQWLPERLLSRPGGARSEALPAPGETLFYPGSPSGDGDIRIRRIGADVVVNASPLRASPGSAGAPDSLRDLIAVDYRGDGSFDRAVEWLDLDGDSRPERMMLYALTSAPLAGDFMSCAIVDQRARERGFWFLERWQYRQAASQGRSDFSGDGFHALGRYDDHERRWHSYGENPYCFFDPDQDGLSEETLLLVGDDNVIRHMRWSFDADHDATAESPYDYDLSLTATGRAIAAADLCDTLALRGGGRLPIVAWEHCRDFVRHTRWARILLAFDENDQNVAPDERETGERWEGVIAAGVPGFAPVGGPDCGLLNKRHELDHDGNGGLRLYTSAMDARVHLFGAEQGWVHVDTDDDGTAEDLLRMEDRNRNGYFDTWLWDRGADGSVDSTACVAADEAPLFAPDWAAICAEESRALAAFARSSDAANTREASPQARRYHASLAGWRAHGPVAPAGGP